MSLRKALSLLVASFAFASAGAAWSQAGPPYSLLTPPQQFFLRENLKLRLLAARFDLLFRDQANFRADLSAADSWLKTYFDTRAKPVQSLQTLLKELRSTDMTIELLGLAGSLDAVRVLQIARDRPQR